LIHKTELKPMKLFNFKVEGSLLIVKIIILAAAAPFLWLTDLTAFVFDLKKLKKKGKTLLTKSMLLACLIIAVLHIGENMLGEISELFIELLRFCWMGLKLINLSNINILGWTVALLGITYLTRHLLSIINKSIPGLSPKQTRIINYTSDWHTLLPDGSFFNYLSQCQINRRRVIF